MTPEIRYLRKLCQDLDHINPDKKNIVEVYHSKTGLNTQLFFRIYEVYEYLKSHSDNSLSDNYNNIRKDFKEYLSKRIEQSQESDPQDQKIQDVIFASQSILKYGMHKLEKVKKEQITETDQLLQKLSGQESPRQKELATLNTALAGG